MHAACYVSLFTRCCVGSALHSFANGVDLTERTLSSSPWRTTLILAQIQYSCQDLLPELLGLFLHSERVGVHDQLPSDLLLEDRGPLLLFHQLADEAEGLVPQVQRRTQQPP